MHLPENNGGPLLKFVFRPILPFIMPVAVLSATLFLFSKWPAWSSQWEYARELKALSVIFPFLPYLFTGAALALEWRFHQTGMVLSAWLVGTTYWCVHQGWCAPGTGLSAVLSCLVFTELTIFSGWRWRQLPLKTAIFWAAAVFLQPVALAGIRRLMGGGIQSESVVSSPLVAHLSAALRQADWSVMPLAFAGMTVFYIAGFYLLFLAFQKRDVLAAGLLGVLLSVFIGLGPAQSQDKPPLFFSSAGLILLFSCIEASFIMAYRDELTGLPSRRALNQALAALGRQYAIAMIDVDHFKRFNDTYGHKTGDQVLKLLSARITRMTGGARAFRYGGEEFTVLFPGKTKEEALPHLETCRRRLFESPFIVRGRARRTSSANRRGKPAKGKTRKQVTVTASFGVAEPGPVFKTPSQVVTAADRALYRAKKAGRNCVKT
jgi:diguanylate cyclase (GGDEF)-like protein